MVVAKFVVTCSGVLGCKNWTLEFADFSISAQVDHIIKTRSSWDAFIRQM